MVVLAVNLSMDREERLCVVCKGMGEAVKFEEVDPAAVLDRVYS
jgi:hypothetical protein